MKWNFFIIIISIVIAIVSIFLGFIFGEFFLFPIFCVIPSVCGARNVNSQENEQEESLLASNQEKKSLSRETISEKYKLYDSCPKCGEIIKYPNLNYCPNCGAKLQKRF
ncbi:MAG: hypothetical protein EU547_06840 [Promethearchaeota archaeon]|nr:MAG: hypothetical protein EU547_06840 [Candidatus Lokiarchaeota archaeon]